MSEQFWWTVIGAVIGAVWPWLTAGVVILFWKRLKNRKSTPRKKKGDCLLIGNPGSGAKKENKSLECWRWNASTIDAEALREEGRIVKV